MSNIQPRAYQLEMFDMSMKNNIIAVLPTGSGKTYIASMRIMAALERCQKHEMVWFLVPTKVLCCQQLECLSRFMPAVSMTMLTGDDEVDYWRNRGIWDTALQGMKVVFSTHAVLADALTHGFVSLNRLALIVFDEAHHCMKSHPGNRIMHDFYHVSKLENSKIPSILGLTASVEVAKIPQLEQNLDAICRAPSLQREELGEYAPYRNLTIISYSRICDGLVNPPAYLETLEKTVTELREHSKSEAYIPSELFKLPSRARAIWHHLGAWALQHFLTKALRQFVQHLTKHENLHSVRSQNHRLKTLKNVLDSIVDGPGINLQSPSSISNKVTRLLSFLKERYRPEFSGIIFVRERVTAHVLSALLGGHQLTQNAFRCATCVSSSVRSESWAKHDALSVESNEDVILQFRNGLKNLIIATSVLEEGIDLPACHLVISFDSPDNITSFIQRRGRARQGVSEFVMMEASDDELFESSSKQYGNLEKQMQNICLDHQRNHPVSVMDDEQSDKVFLQLRLDTGALLTSENATSHLYHFCTSLRGEPLSEIHPTFSYKKNSEGRTRATVYLPSGIDRSLRIVDGRHWWGTKRSARHDAAFQAVRALHGHKLINDHLLPLFSDNPWTREIQENGILAELPDGENLINFWKGIPGVWTERKLYKCRINFATNGNDRPDLAMALFTPVKLLVNDEVDLYWDNQTQFTVTLQPLNTEIAVSPCSRQLMREITTLLFQSTRASLVQEQYPEFLPFFTPDLPLQDLKDWLSVNKGSITICGGQTRVPILAPSGFIRSPSLYFVPHIFVSWIRGIESKELFIECRKFGNRKNLLERAPLSPKALNEASSFKITRTAAAECILESLPWELGQASLAIPPIIQLLHRQQMANEIQTKLFKDLPMIGLRYLEEAITAPSSQWPSNYQRLEFFGDSILKFVVALHAFSKYPLWHEGYLSKFKEQLISNERLTGSAANAHLERFICADFITRKHPVFSPAVNQLQNRTLPKKVFADVIEALTAAAYESGDVPLSQQLLAIFLPELSKISTELQLIDDKDHTFPADLEEKIDLLLAFKFQNRVLIWEALTHPSWQRDNRTGSYQRLEFLGDAILDFLVSKNLYNQCPKLGESRMTELRAALVNADFLAFLCMQLTLTEPCCHKPTSIPENCGPSVPLKNISFWMFMRHDAPELIRMQASCSERYQRLGDEIKWNLEHGVAYPWAMLAQLAAPKFYSDLIESTLGAIYIDSRGSIFACEQFLERINLITHLERFVGQAVHLEHPRNSLDRFLGTRRSDLQLVEIFDGIYSISVWLGGEKIACIENCLTKSEAVVRGADAALAYLSKI